MISRFFGRVRGADTGRRGGQKNQTIQLVIAKMSAQSVPIHN